MRWRQREQCARRQCPLVVPKDSPREQNQESDVGNRDHDRRQAHSPFGNRQHGQKQRHHVDNDWLIPDPGKDVEVQRQQASQLVVRRGRDGMRLDGEYRFVVVQVDRRSCEKRRIQQERTGEEQRQLELHSTVGLSMRPMPNV